MDQDDNHDEDEILNQIMSGPDREQRMREDSFRRGACHAIVGAERIAVWYGTSEASIIDALQIYGQVIDDWRCGVTANEGFSDNPWTWKRETYETYVKMQQPKW